MYTIVYHCLPMLTYVYLLFTIAYSWMLGCIALVQPFRIGNVFMDLGAWSVRAKLIMWSCSALRSNMHRAIWDRVSSA